MKQTPLKKIHEKAGARLVPFGGWNMPLQYRPILEEARKVRSEVGLFDLCHMGRFEVQGPGAEAFLQHCLTNDLTKIKKGLIRYALLCKEDGGVLDDVLVYHAADEEDRFFVVVNASNTEKDWNWFQEQKQSFDCELRDRTQELAMIALQGRNSAKVLQEITTLDLEGLGYYKWAPGKVLGFDAEISRTGYTGEDGFEIYFPVAKAEETWNALMEKGHPHGIWPIGLGARDTLRLEAGMSLYGHELTEDINPLEAGLQWAVKLGTDFIGRDALKKIKEEGPKRKLVGLKLEGKRVPRQGYPVLAGEETVGEVASGTYSPILEGNIATAFVPRDLDETREDLRVQIRNTQAKARVTPLPFYKRNY